MRNRLAIGLTLGIFGAVLLGAYVCGYAPETVKGSVRAEGTAEGSVAFAVTDCLSGHVLWPSFSGAALRGDGGLELRVAGSGDGARLSLYPKGVDHGAIQFGKNDCSRWDVDVVGGQGMVNRTVSTMDGHVRVACRAVAGSMTADVDFANCRE